MDFQQPHHHGGYNMRPPPPPTPSDPLHHRPPPPGQWYPGQYNYQHPPPPSSHLSSSSATPPHQQQQWTPHPPSDHYAAAPPPPPYPPQHQFHHQYPPPHRPQNVPPYPPPQDWGNAWSHHQGYPVRQDEEDWAAKARAWAASKAASDNQLPQSHFTSVSRIEGQTHYHDQYVDSHHSDVQPPNPALAYHQYPTPGPPLQRPSLQPQEYTANSGTSSFVPDDHATYSAARDGNLAGYSNAVYPHQESPSASSLAHMQEVPSSYSSVTGIIETADQSEKLYKSFPLPTDSSLVPFHVHTPPPPVGRSSPAEQPHYSLSNQAANPSVDLSDQPLNFTRRFSFDHDPVMQQHYSHNDSGVSVRGADHVATNPLTHTWTTPPSHGTIYPPVPLVFSSAQQQEMPVVSGHSTPLFGRISGPSFQPSIPSVGPPFGIGMASALHSTTAFPGDVYGVPNVSDRPKKPQVPNWLKEEIIKNKAVIASSGPERPTDSIEEEAVDGTPGRADGADSKSVDSPRSTVEDYDEDYVEAARTAQVNQEIKRILTEVLLKVTDNLFDEIASKVLREDDLTVQVAQNTIAPDDKLLSSASAVTTPKASAKVVVAAKTKEIRSEEDIGKSTSGPPGDLLGLGSYASDSDEDDGNTVQPPSSRKLSHDECKSENGNLQVESEKQSKSQGDVNNHKSGVVSSGAAIHHVVTANQSSELITNRGSFDGNGVPRYSSNTISGDMADEVNFDSRKTVMTSGTSKPNHSVGEKVTKTGLVEDVDEKMSSSDESQGEEVRSKQEHKDGRSSSVGKDIVKALNGSKDRKAKKEDESHRRHDERYAKKERNSEKSNGSEEKMKEQGGISVGKAKDSDSRKRPIDPDGKEDRKERGRDRRASDRDDSDRRREREKDDAYRRREREKDKKGERSREKHGSEASRHKRRPSPLDGNKVRNNKGNGHYSSDESSDDSKRKLHVKRRNLSPSPDRSRKRQDSRSPPSKRTHRRHSPFSSLETTRGRRSRSRSPVRRHR